MPGQDMSTRSISIVVALLIISLNAAFAQSTPATMTSPTPGSTLTGSSVVFTWSAGSGPTAYWLDVGNVAGGNQYYQSGNLGDVLTITVNGLPTDGSAVYVTLYSMIDGQWQSVPYTYTAFNLAAAGGVLTTPAPSSTLTGSSVTFDWTAGAGASAYWLDVGSTAGGNQYYQSGNLGTALTTTVNGLPTDGSTIYVTLNSLIGGVWSGTPYTYTAFNSSGATLAVMQTPTPSSILTGSSVVFTWSAGSGPTAYWLDIGNVAGGNQYYQSGNLGTALTTTVNGLPTNGSAVYVTLYSLIAGQWQSNAYIYTAFNVAAAGGVLTTPTPGSTLTGSSIVFDWTAGTGASAYWLDVGSTVGGNQYYQSGNLGTALTTTVNGLPTNGSTIYVTLHSLISGVWSGTGYTYTTLNAAAGKATMQTPTPGSTLTGSSITFDWNAGSGATAYWLNIGNAADGNQYYQSGTLGNVLTTTVSGLPTNGSTVYVTLYSMVAGQWESNAYTYTALNAASGLAVMQTPTPGSTLGQTATFTWSADANATAYWLNVGNDVGGNQYYQSGNLGDVLTTTVYRLPTNGSTLYVTLYSLVAGQWLSNAYTYKAATGFTLVQHVHNTDCGSSTTCAIPLSQSIGAGHLLVFESSMYPEALMTATNNGGEFVQCISCVGDDPSSVLEETSGGWILSTSAQSSPITVTFSTATSGAIEMWEYSYTGGTPGFDGANQNLTQNSSSPTAIPFTPTSGSYDISVQACRADADCNSVSSPFAGDNTGNDYAWAYLDNVLNWTAPTWTLASSGISQLTQMEFGFGVESCANTSFVDFGGTNGSAVSVAQLASGTHGWHGGTWTINGAGSDLTFQTSASQTLQNPTGRLCDGGYYTDSSTTGLQYSTASNDTYVQMNATNGMLTGTSVSAGAWYYSTLPGPDLSRTDDFAIFGTRGADYILLHEFGDGTNRNGEIECGGGQSTTNGTGGSVILARATWYWVDIVYNVTGNHTMKIYNNANPPVLVGSLTCPSLGTTQPAYVTLGNVNLNAITSGYTFDYDGLKVSLDGTDPLLP